MDIKCGFGVCFLARLFLLGAIGALYFSFASCRELPESTVAVAADASDPLLSTAERERQHDVAYVWPYDTSIWKDIEVLIPDVILDIKYATPDNFTGQQIYDCAACLLRTEAALALSAVAREAAEMGYALRLFDCYRPAPFQQRLWDVVPDKRYVAPPEKGSNHSRGMAIDLTLVDGQSGEDLDMGTPYDFLSKESHPGYPGHSEAVQENRRKLSHLMEKHGFAPITSEWWHFDFQGKRYAVSDFLWDCEKGRKR